MLYFWVINMKKQCLVLVLSSLISLSSFAAIPDGNDTTTKPDIYFLKNSEAIDSLAILPPPPEVGSIAFLNDQAMYEKGRMLRNTPRGEQASIDAEISHGEVEQTLSEAFGFPINEKEAPEIYKLLQNILKDASYLATRSAKLHYMRIRPFVFYGVDTCNPKDQEKLKTNGSYPSGHSTTGWAMALVLSEINPERADIILKRGYEIGQSRVICGYHWQSDVDAARMVAAAIVAKLHANDKFMAQLGKAKAEFSKLKSK